MLNSLHVVITCTKIRNLDLASTVRRGEGYIEVSDLSTPNGPCLSFTDHRGVDMLEDVYTPFLKEFYVIKLGNK